ncbi:hypothetical protein RJ639_005156 [Escallonia herrerae]|uniref:Alliinase C-terminal domain-containing protein n=1 Tax=Escallonia herrerae TaxID=1293975 RepID=A0AA89AZ30_9ASTE|nr:hypothetical protein RJ639_005156 [Escallonia herrerae]
MKSAGLFMPGNVAVGADTLTVWSGGRTVFTKGGAIATVGGTIIAGIDAVVTASVIIAGMAGVATVGVRAMVVIVTTFLPRLEDGDMAPPQRGSRMGMISLSKCEISLAKRGERDVVGDRKVEQIDGDSSFAETTPSGEVAEAVVRQNLKNDLLDMVEQNELNRSLLALLDENISNANKGNQLLKLLKVVLEGEGREIFGFAHKTMSDRWEKLSEALSSSKRFSIQDLAPQYCSFFQRVRGPSPEGDHWRVVKDTINLENGDPVYYAAMFEFCKASSKF